MLEAEQVSGSPSHAVVEQVLRAVTQRSRNDI